jgi:orotate phosphoribosyltransferase
MERDFLIEQIKKFAVKRGNFTLASGKKSTYYLDLKLAYTNPDVMKEIIFEMKKRLQGSNVDRIAGMELGAVPLAVALSLETEIPFVIIRKEKKGYGAAKRIEGIINEGDNVLLVEDVATTGGSIASAVEAVRDAGGKCSMAIAILDRLEGAAENLQKINISMTSLLTIEDLGL